MIPRIYDAPRVVRIVGKDEKESMVQVNGQVMTEEGPMPVNDLRIGKYDIRVSVGPNYSTRRQETAEGMLEFIRVVPGAAQIIGDLVAKAMDWPDADRISERLEKALPPGMIDPKDMTPEQQQAMQAAQQQQAQQAQIAAAAQQIEMQKNEAESVEAQADAQKARFEAEEKRLEVLVASGALDAAIAQRVNEQVARVLQSTIAPQRAF